MWDHPRIRGTNISFASPYCPTTGSSPHTRDKSGIITEHIFQGRIIPAYAGQMYTFQQIHKFVQDHPRIRGTNGHITNLTGYRLGSSPHTRDK